MTTSRILPPAVTLQGGAHLDVDANRRLELLAHGPLQSLPVRLGPGARRDDPDDHVIARPLNELELAEATDLPHAEA